MSPYSGTCSPLQNELAGLEPLAGGTRSASRRWGARFGRGNRGPMMSERNWNRGLLRTWIVLSILWIVVTGIALRVGPDVFRNREASETVIFANPQGGIATKPWERNWSKKDMESCAQARMNDRSLGNPIDCFDDPSGTKDYIGGKYEIRDRIASFAMLSTLPPLAVFAIWWIAVWIARGFAAPKR